VIPRNALAYLSRDGFDTSAAVIERLSHSLRTDATFRPRSTVEHDDAFVQPIALAYVRWQDRVLAVPGDDRAPADSLYRRWTAWVGGHVGQADATDGDPVRSALVREIAEELGGISLPGPELVGVVTDSSTDRSRRHLGLVHRVVIDDPLVAMALERLAGDATGELHIVLLPADQIMANFDRLEPWSQFIVREQGYAERARERV
jgi:predicted NUDIX family phosphoesterase